MNRNIFLAYLLTFSKNSWFWLGIWVFYYLRFTNYAGIGIAETALIFAMTATEIPTGAIADLFGKKKTLILSFLLQSVGAFWMTFTPDFFGLVGSVLVMGVGGTFFSGTLEALVYDSLKQQKQEDRYDKVIATIGSIQLIAPAVCGIVGGFLYTISPQLPFFANASFYFLGMLSALLLIEPVIDTEKFSLKNYLIQTKQGFRQLFKNADTQSQTLLLLSVGVIVVILDEMLNSFLGVEFGFQAESIGLVWGGIFLAAALASQLTPEVRKQFGLKGGMIFTGGMIAFTLLLSPALGLFTGAISLLVRASLQTIYGNLTSIAINRKAESKYRATTLSTFNTFKNLPYVLTAFFFGTIADMYTAKIAAFGLGVVLSCLLMFQIINFKLKEGDD